MPFSQPGIEYDGLVFIGRFQPLHKGHMYVIREAAKMARKILIIVGSASTHPDIRNPFTFLERSEMLKTALEEEGISNYIIGAQEDVPYNDSIWISDLHELVGKHFTFLKDKVGLVGHAKDHSSYYLKLFPQWPSIDITGVNDFDGSLLNATEIREVYFNSYNISDRNFCAETMSYLSHVVPASVNEFLKKYWTTEKYTSLVKEADFIQDYKKQWDKSPYPPIFVTVDAVVVQAGHILLVKRKACPGQGMLALPGGFIEQYERLEDATIRELTEETKIDIPPGVLKNKVVDQKYFAYPHRSTRGRTITFATLFDLNDELERKQIIRTGKNGRPMGMTRVKGADDAESAGWYRISDLKQDMLFEDHFSIIQTMIAQMD